ncbi:MAG: hypothetical protein AB7N91_15190 [Candidatus Tectimicrobiota bacterium]
MMRGILLFVVSGLLWGWSVAPVAAQASLIVAQSDQYGTYLTDSVGRAVYLFTADRQGAGELQAASRCTDACAQAWPPLTTTGQPQAGPQAQAALLGTIQRQEGTRQVTYNGWPLYYFAQDQPQSQPGGQEKKGFGGAWYLVQPQGMKVAAQP